MAKRTRVALIACNRCIVTKRKCDGDFASGKPCRNCNKSGAHCEYNTKRNPNYIKLLEQRINLLERKLEECENKNENESASSARLINGNDRNIHPCIALYSVFGEGVCHMIPVA